MHTRLAPPQPSLNSELKFRIIIQKLDPNLGRVPKAGGVGRNLWSCAAYREYKERE